MNHKKGVSDQDNGLLTIIRQVEYKQVGKRYDDMKEIYQNEESEKESQFREIAKQDIEGSLMKFDEESHTNLSDSEKETQITQTTYQADHQDKLNLGGQQELSLNAKNKNPNSRYQAFEKGINQIQEYQQKQLEKLPEKQFKLICQNENQFDSKQQLSKPNRIINIFSDQRKMNQQILNETIQKKNQNSMIEIGQFVSKDEHNCEQKSVKSQGTFSRIEGEQVKNNICKTPKSYIDYYKQINQHKNSKNIEQNKEEISPSILLNNPQIAEQEHLKQNLYCSHNQKSPNSESIPFSNASTIQSVQNNSDTYQNSYHNSQNSTPISKEYQETNSLENKNHKTSSFEIRKPSFIQYKYRGSGINQQKNNQISGIGTINPNYLSTGSINQISRTNSDIMRPSEKKKSFLESQQQMNAIISFSDKNIQIQEEEERQVNDQNDNSEQLIQNLNQNINYTNDNFSDNNLNPQANINQENNVPDKEIAEEEQIIIVPTEQSMTEEQINSNFLENKRRRNSKKDHLLNELYQFQNGEAKNTCIIVSHDNISPQKNTLLEENNTPNSKLTRKPFLALRKRIQRQNRNTLELTQNDGKQNNSRDQTQNSEIQLINLSQDSLQESQNQFNKIQVNEEQITNPQADRQSLNDIVSLNYNKIAHELQRDLSGSKQKQFSQVEKKVVQDFALNDNSFSDDSPPPFAQNLNLQQNGSNNLFLTKQFQNQQQKKQQKANLQQFQTQIMSDSNESNSDLSPKKNENIKIQDNKEQVQAQDNNNKIKNSLVKLRNCSIDNSYGKIKNEAIGQLQMQPNTPDSENVNNNQPNYIRYQKDSNLIIFSNQMIDGSDAAKSVQQLDDYNNFIVPQSLLISACKEIEDESFQNLQKSNKIDEEVTKDDKNIISESNNQREIKGSPLQRAYISNQLKTNIIHFETEEDLDHFQSQEQNEESPQQKNTQEEEDDDEDEQKQIGHDIIISEYQVDIPSKSRRIHRFKAFSQNNTPMSSQDKTQNSSQYRNSAEQTIKTFKPSTFYSKINQYQQQKQGNSCEEGYQQQQDSPNISNSQILLQQQIIPIFLIPPSDIDGEQQIINLNDTQKNEIEENEGQESKIQDNLFTQSDDDIEEYDDEEDEDEDELDEEEEDEVEIENLKIFQSIKKRTSSQKQEELHLQLNEDSTKQKEQTKYNQREIGIGKYFCEKLFNVYGDNKLFQKKKRKLKKWRKMIQIAEDSLIRRSEESNNYEYSQIDNQGLMDSNYLMPIASLQQSSINQFTNSKIQQNSMLKDPQQNQQFDQQQNPDQYDRNGNYSERIKIFQQKLLEQNKKITANTYLKKGFDSEQQNNVEGENELNQKCNRDDLFTAQEEFELIYYFKKIKRNDFYKALRKGPPMWYRWSAWKVALDLNVEEYRLLYEKLMAQLPQNQNQSQNNPVDKQINKDITRTMPCEPFFSDPNYSHQSLESLRCVLKAVSIQYDSVGYCQGMNFFAAYLLLINGGDELQTFAMFLQMEKKLNIMGLFEEGFPLIQFMNFIFQREFGRKFPKLCRHFNNLKIPETMWVVQWFQTLFLNSLSLNVVCRFWDYIFYSGCILSVISISLSLIHEFSAHLIKMDIDEISQFTQKLKSCQVVKGEMRNSPCKPKPLLSPLIHLLQKDSLVTEDNIIIDPEKIIKRAQNYEIPKKEILSYINEFKQINFLYKDKPFLQKMEIAINQNHLEHIHHKPHNKGSSSAVNNKSIKPIFSQQNTPKKFYNDQKESELSYLLHPKTQNDSKKSGFSLFGFIEKKTQKNM